MGNFPSFEKCQEACITYSYMTEDLCCNWDQKSNDCQVNVGYTAEKSSNPKDQFFFLRMFEPQNIEEVMSVIDHGDFKCFGSDCEEAPDKGTATKDEEKEDENDKEPEMSEEDADTYLGNGSLSLQSAKF